MLAEASLILAAVFWGLNFAAKYAAGFMPPLLIVGLRLTVGGLLLVCLLRNPEPGGRPGPAAGPTPSLFSRNEDRPRLLRRVACRA